MKVLMMMVMFLSIILVNSINPMILILLMLLMMFILSLDMYMISMIAWFPLLMIMVLVGGLLVVYTLVICMIPNELMVSFNTSTSKILLIFPTLVISLKMMQKDYSSFKMVFKMDWYGLIFMSILIIIMMLMMMGIIKTNKKTLKTMF